MCALTHALEALISIFASPYTDTFCLQAMHLIEARTAMANAATLAGLAFSNAFVGVNHALAHALGARFKLPHGRVNGILLPLTLRYNAEVPSKFMPAPGYTTYVAPEKLAQASRILGLCWWASPGWREARTTSRAGRWPTAWACRPSRPRP
jgi:acetaldehyde dehydrogenase/alcohol dehydrogenase